MESPFRHAEKTLLFDACLRTFGPPMYIHPAATPSGAAAGRFSKKGGACGRPWRGWWLSRIRRHGTRPLRGGQAALPLDDCGRSAGRGGRVHGADSCDVSTCESPNGIAEPVGTQAENEGRKTCQATFSMAETGTDSPQDGDGLLKAAAAHEMDIIFDTSCFSCLINHVLLLRNTLPRDTMCGVRQGVFRKVRRCRTSPPWRTS